MTAGLLCHCFCSSSREQFLETIETDPRPFESYNEGEWKYEEEEKEHKDEEKEEVVE